MDDGQGVDRSVGPCREGRRCRESQAPRPGRERPEQNGAGGWVTGRLFRPLFRSSW